jgi:hypothetical protein
MGDQVKINKAVVCAAFASLFTTSVQAGVFIGGGINNNSYNYDNVENSTGSQLYAGYYFDSGVFVEIARVDLGEADVEATSVTIEMSGMAYYIGYKSELSTGFGWYAKGGMYSLDTEVTGLGEESSSGLTLGGGILYAFNKHFALRAGLQTFIGVEDFDQDESVFGGSVSLEARF